MEENKDVFYLSEHFVSLQGEGNCAGLNSLFLRFHFCNLTCTWCDTKYTWVAASGQFQPYTSATLKALISAHHTEQVILTGGEPTLYRLDNLVVPGKKYHVESNGVFIPTAPLAVTIADGTAFRREGTDESVISHFNWVISPKLSNARQQINGRGNEVNLLSPINHDQTDDEDDGGERRKQGTARMHGVPLSVRASAAH